MNMTEDKKKATPFYATRPIYFIFIMNNQVSWQQILSRIFIRIPFPVLRRLARINLLIAYFHILSDEDVIHVKHLYKYKNTRQFNEDIDFILKSYSPISLRELFNSIKNSHRLPENAFLLTFDDGYREINDIVAPILLEKGIPATFFVCSAFTDNNQLWYRNKASLLIERYQRSRSTSLELKLSVLLRSRKLKFDDIPSGILSVSYLQRDLLDDIANVLEVDFNDYLHTHKPYLTSDHIKKLIENGFTMGAHSIDHPQYFLLPLEEQLRQTMKSVRFVRETFHLDYGVFSFPFSDYKVSDEFFSRLFHYRFIDLTFGTAGPMKDLILTNLQRINLEMPHVKAERIIENVYAERLARMASMNDKIIRD